MIVFPPAKINLGLNIVRKRADGFHDLQTVFVAIPLRDAMEVIIDRTLENGQFIITYSGIPICGDPITDLCRRALLLLQRDKPLPGFRLHLHKAIPMGAGLGGGSSDAAHTLLLVNDLLDLGLSNQQLASHALVLGSDVPFFLHGTAMLGAGRGDEMVPIELNLSGYWLQLVHPGIHVSTADAFGNTKPSGKEEDLASILAKDPTKWKDELVNGMEEQVFGRHPLIGALKNRLYDHGALYAAMSGSGSSVFGIFRTEPDRLALAAGERQWVVKL